MPDRAGRGQLKAFNKGHSANNHIVKYLEDIYSTTPVDDGLRTCGDQIIQSIQSPLPYESRSKTYITIANNAYDMASSDKGYIEAKMQVSFAIQGLDRGLQDSDHPLKGYIGHKSGNPRPM
jgi:hypothetical protein